MKAILEVEFNPDEMFTQEEIDNEYGGSWVDGMNYLIESDDVFGVFGKNPTVIEVKECGA